MSPRPGLPYEPQPYPSARYHATLGTRVVNNELEDSELGEGWSREPIVMGGCQPASNPVSAPPLPSATPNAQSELANGLAALQQEHEELQKANAEQQAQHEEVVAGFNRAWDELTAKHKALEEEFNTLQAKHDELLAAATPPPAAAEEPAVETTEPATRKRGK